MPMIVLVVIGSIAGAVGVTGGLMLLVGSLDSADFSRGDFTDTVSNSFGWSLLLLVLAIGGIVIQARQRALMRQSIQRGLVRRGRLTRSPRGRRSSPSHPCRALLR